MLLCDHHTDINWTQDAALGEAAQLHFQREYFHREICRNLNAPIIWRLSPVGWLESGMVLSFSQRNLHLYRSPVIRAAGAGTTEDPEYRVIPENLSYRSCATRRVFAQPDGMLEELSDIPLFESDRNS